jgi:hypothetical protein
MQITLTIDDDALLQAEAFATRNQITLDLAVSELTRAGAEACISHPSHTNVLRGRFALLPRRDEVITPEHVSKLLQRSGG